MKHLSRSAAFLVFASALAPVAHAQSGDEYQLDSAPPASTLVIDDQGRSEFVMPSSEAAVSMPAAVPASTPVPAAAPAKIPAAIVPAEQAPAPVVVVPSDMAPAPAPAMKLAPERAHAIPLINTKQDTKVHDGVTYVTGGVGDDELASIKAAKSEYNVYVMSASLNGAFVGDSHVVITDKTGTVMLDTVAGPLLYVKLPAGSYVLDANLGEQKKHQAFTIGKKAATANVHLGWKVDAMLSN